MHNSTTSSSELVQNKLIAMLQDVTVSPAQIEKEINDYFAEHGTSSPSTTTFVYDRFGVVSAAWTISHNLNKFPQVTLIDDQGNEFEADVFYNNLNQVTVVFAVPTSGKAVLI